MIEVRKGLDSKIPSIFFVILLVVFSFSLSACLSSESTALAKLPAGTLNLSNSSTVSFAPALAVNGNIIYIVWSDSVNDNQEIFLVRSGDGGLSFSVPLNISETADPSNNPRIAISGTSLYVVWEEFVTIRDESDIFFRKAEDNAGVLSWSSSQNLSFSVPVCGPYEIGVDPCPSQFPAIAADGDFILVAWSEAENYVLKDITLGDTGKDFSLINGDISLVASGDRGENFNLLGASPIVLSKQDPTPSASPSLAAQDGIFYIAWTDFIPPNLDQTASKIVFRSYDSATSIFTPPIGSLEAILSTPVSGPAGPELAAEGINSYLVFEGTPTVASACTPSSDIFFSKSIDDFATVPSVPPVNLSNSNCRASSGKISVSGENIYIVWEDNSPSLNGILFRKSNDGGLTFSDVSKLTDTGSSVSAPTISATATNIFVAWEDALLGNLEIFFNKK